ncbi:MAG: symmetrical bis(5'-nucleosyl)-tetraphosphatase [Mariprofundaceae bacterium]|nr:symmetrical bis(5'-nucleosyl)-tetraphosphatase [Mariprofundaceae bacterium]
MAIYAIGDIQGCYRSLRKLLKTVRFDPSCDQLWCAGDMVNRGKDSLLTLRYLRSLGDAAVCVLGNHDIHLLEQAAGAPARAKDTLNQVLQADDCDGLLDWLRHRPLLHHNAALHLTMVHAGLSPQWTFKKACRRARKVELALQQDDWKNTCRAWRSALFPEWEPLKGDARRLLFAMAVLTNTRFCNQQGRFNWHANHTDIEREGDQPWYRHAYLPWHADAGTVLFGHWAAMGLIIDQPHVLGLDSGCVWGGHLTLARVDCRPFQLTKLRCSCCLPVL